jgi:biofilm protein TabA
MILDTLANADRYAALHPLFPQAFAFLRGAHLAALAPGRHLIEGERLFAIAQAAAGRSRTEANLECHRRYIDIQLVLSGTEEMGWKPVRDCSEPSTDYSVERDIQFFRDVPGSWIATPPGAFCIFFPQDAHAPLVGSGSIRKVVLKIAMD